MHPACVYDLRQRSVREAWEGLVPRVHSMRSDRREFLETCQHCPLVTICLWCPAHAYLETGELDGYTPYFCTVAHAREAATRAQATRSSRSLD